MRRTLDFSFSAAAAMAAAAALGSSPSIARDIAPQPRAQPAARTVAPGDGQLAPEASLAALLGIIGIGGAGFLATRSRRRHELDGEPADQETEPSDETFPPAAITSIPDELAIAGNVGMTAPSEESEVLAPAGEARDELLRRMVAAPPDEANPFHAHKARMRRARMILQAREHAAGDASTTPFDRSTPEPRAFPHPL
jgi:hypothetical protein